MGSACSTFSQISDTSALVTPGILSKKEVDSENQESALRAGGTEVQN